MDTATKRLKDIDYSLGVMLKNFQWDDKIACCENCYKFIDNNKHSWTKEKNLKVLCANCIDKELNTEL